MSTAVPIELPSHRTVRLQDGGFALAWLVGLVLLVPVQVASMIAFDATGLDTLAPDFVFMAVVPGLALALVPALVGRSLYGRRATVAIAAVAVIAFTLVAWYAMGFYGLCGPGC